MIRLITSNLKSPVRILGPTIYEDSTFGKVASNLCFYSPKLTTKISTWSVVMSDVCGFTLLYAITHSDRGKV